MSDFLKDVIKETGNEYASLVSDGASGDVDSFIDTGSYIFNAYPIGFSPSSFGLALAIKTEV